MSDIYFKQEKSRVERIETLGDFFDTIYKIESLMTPEQKLQIIELIEKHGLIDPKDRLLLDNKNNIYLLEQVHLSQVNRSGWVELKNGDNNSLFEKIVYSLLAPYQFDVIGYNSHKTYTMSFGTVVHGVHLHDSSTSDWGWYKVRYDWVEYL